MRVLFVLSGNSEKNGVASFIRAQGESLRREGVAVSYFAINGRGVIGYLKNIPKLRQEYRSEDYDVIHAHFGYSALLALLARPTRPVVVSFMGSDVHGQVDGHGRAKGRNVLTRAIASLVGRWAHHLIVKSPEIRAFFAVRENVTLLPNGVDLDRFRPADRAEARRALGFEDDERIVLFLGDPANDIKNFPLCRDAVASLRRPARLVAPYPCNHDSVARHLTAADVLVVTSFHEGSPNVVKEAMACGCPVVSTDVGDVAWLLQDVEGSRVVGFDPLEVSRAIEAALAFGRRTNGRERLLELGLDSEEVARRLARIYRRLLVRAGETVPAVREGLRS